MLFPHSMVDLNKQRVIWEEHSRNKRLVELLQRQVQMSLRFLSVHSFRCPLEDILHFYQCQFLALVVSYMNVEHTIVLVGDREHITSIVLFNEVHLEVEPLKLVRVHLRVCRQAVLLQLAQAVLSLLVVCQETHGVL